MSPVAMVQQLCTDYPKAAQPGQPNIGAWLSQNFVPRDMPKKMVLVFEMVESESDQEQLPAEAKATGQIPPSHYQK
jgi:hypothetical protein